MANLYQLREFLNLQRYEMSEKQKNVLKNILGEGFLKYNRILPIGQSSDVDVSFVRIELQATVMSNLLKEGLVFHSDKLSHIETEIEICAFAPNIAFTLLSSALLGAMLSFVVFFQLSEFQRWMLLPPIAFPLLAFLSIRILGLLTKMKMRGFNFLSRENSDFFSEGRYRLVIKQPKTDENVQPALKTICEILRQDKFRIVDRIIRKGIEIHVFALLDLGAVDATGSFTDGPVVEQLEWMKRMFVDNFPKISSNSLG